MASATRSDLSADKIIEFEDAGRGNQDDNVIVNIPATAATFSYNVFSGSDTLAYFTTTATLIEVPIVGNDTGTVVIRAGANTDTGTLLTITLPTSATTGDLVRSAIAEQLAADDDFASATTRSGQAEIAIALSQAGATAGTPSITSQATGTGGVNEIVSFVPGVSEDSFEETVFNFTGPFTNINPNKDALQGLSIVARAINTFLNGYSTAAESGINQLIIDFKGALDTAFPAASELPGIPANVSGQLGKITLKGSRRPSTGLLGRDEKTIDNIFVNDAANFGLRQLTLRIYDSLIDVLDFIEAGGNTAGDFTNSKNEAIKLAREFNIDFGELERALGRNRAGDVRSEIPYENTIVNGSGDQGMLIYADEIADIVNTLNTEATTSYSLLRDAVGMITSKERLLLKN